MRPEYKYYIDEGGIPSLRETLEAVRPAALVSDANYYRETALRLAAEMRKPRRTIKAVYDQGAWELAELLDREEKPK